jgi:cell division protein ZapA (FtsZ GTPase activity inhibitor)
MNGEDKVRFTVDIFGNSYKMVGSQSEKHMKMLAAFVNEHMERVAKSNPRLDTLKVAILALVNMADDYYESRLQGDLVETEHAQAKLRIEELRKAFELSEEKERTKSLECQKLAEQVAALAQERDTLALELEEERSKFAQELASERDKLVRELGEEQDKLVTKLVEEHDAHVKKLVDANDALVKKLVEDHDVLVKKLMEERDSLQKNLGDQRDEFLKKLTDQRNELVSGMEEEREKLLQEMEMSSAAWADRVTEWEGKYAELAKERDQLVHEVAVAREVAAASLAAAARSELEASDAESGVEAAFDSPDEQELQPSVGIPAEIASEDQELLEKYNKLQEEYIKLQNEFNEWIQLTQSQTQ